MADSIRQNDSLSEKSGERPTSLSVRFKNLPSPLRNLNHFVVWKYTLREGKWTKPPYNPRIGDLASPTNPATWADYETAKKAYRSGKWDGIGFVLTKDSGIVGIDLDHCRNLITGDIEPWAKDIIDQLKSYTEVSPSGKGIRIVICAKKSPGRCRKDHIEIYDNARYLTLTGHHLKGTPVNIKKRNYALKTLHKQLFEPSSVKIDKVAISRESAKNLSDEQIIRKAKKAKNRDKFLQLWFGNTSSYRSASEADLALCSILAFWTNGNKIKIDRLFRKSKLYREKWERDDYRNEVIKKAVESSRTCSPTGNRTLKENKTSQATLLVSLAKEIELFHTPGDHDCEAYGTVTISGHKETYKLSSKGFKHWITKKFYDETGKAPSSQALADAINVLVGKAIHEGKERPVAVRFSTYAGAIWLDLADSGWRTVKITSEGWSVEKTSPIRFIRRRGMLPLPKPRRKGELNHLRDLVNIPDDESWIKFLSWLLKAFNPDWPFPILVVNGEQGSAKSTLCRIARNLVDPNEAPLRRPPRDERDLMLAATNGWVVCFDNISGIRPDLSDTLCCLSTGGGFGTRELYTDDSEKLFSAMRPVILNGIEDIATRADLLDRSLILTLSPISDHKRRSEADIWKRFKRLRPKILGAILNIVSAGLKNLPDVHLDHSPRLADFARWITACEPAMGLEPGAFLRAYKLNISQANSLAIENSIIAGPLKKFLKEQNHCWSGTATQLLKELTHIAGESTSKMRDWPKQARLFSGHLRRIAPNLRKTGIDVQFGHTGKSRKIIIRTFK